MTDFKFRELKDEFSGIDQDALLVINARRMIFASGKLSVEVTKTQLPKKVGLVSKTGVSGLPTAAKSIIDAENERKKIELEAEEKEKKAKSE